MMCNLSSSWARARVTGSIWSTSSPFVQWTMASTSAERSQSTYAYRTERVNGKPVTKYIGKSSSAQAKAYEKSKEEKKQLRNREEELHRLNEQLENALKLIK